MHRVPLSMVLRPMTLLSITSPVCPLPDGSSDRGLRDDQRSFSCITALHKWVMLAGVFRLRSTGGRAAVQSEIKKLGAWLESDGRQVPPGTVSLWCWVGWAHCPMWLVIFWRSPARRHGSSPRWWRAEPDGPCRSKMRPLADDAPRPTRLVQIVLPHPACLPNYAGHCSSLTPSCAWSGPMQWQA